LIHQRRYFIQQMEKVMSIIGKCLSAVFLYAICSVSSFANETGNTTNNSAEPEAAAAIPKKPGPSFYGGLKVGAYARHPFILNIASD